MSAVRPCMVSFFFSPEYSGSSVQAFNLCRHLIARGDRPFIVSANLSGSAASEIREGVPIFRIACRRSGELQVPSFYLSLTAFLLRHRNDYDVIHVHGTLRHGIASLVGNVLRKPTVIKVAMANSDIAFHRQGRIWGRLNRFMIKRFDAIVATTDDIVDECRDQGLPTERVRLIPNGVDTHVFRPVSPTEKPRLRLALGLPDGPVVAYVGIINSRKNVDGILRIWQTAVLNGGEGTLIIIGPPPSQDESDRFYRGLQSFITQHGLGSRVRFLGHLDPVVPYLQAADIFLFPSRQEGMPNAVLEAMACGLPCLVSRSAGVDSLVPDDVGGIAIDVADEQRFAHDLLDLLRNSARRQRLGQEARRLIVERFSLVAVADRYRDLYRHLLGGAPGGT